MREVAVGIVIWNGRILACQRKKSARYPLKWEFPGGKLEPGESPLQAMKRELHEELGIIVLEAREFHSQEWKYPASFSGGRDDGSFRVFYFLLTSFSGEIANHAFEDIRWVGINELEALDLLEGNREAVALLRSTWNGGNRERA